GGFRSSLDPRVKVTEFRGGRVAKALIPMAFYLNRSPRIPTLVFGMDCGVGLGFLRNLRILKTPFVYREGSSPRDKKSPLRYRFGIGGVDGIIVQSRVAAKDLESLGVSGIPKRQICNPLASTYSATRQLAMLPENSL